MNQYQYKRTLDSKIALTILCISLGITAVALAFYNIGGLKYGLKLALVVWFLFLGFFLVGSPKLLTILYLLSIPIASAFVLFAPFYKEFGGFYVETRNIAVPFSTLARPDGVYPYNIIEFFIIFALIDVMIDKKESLKFKPVLVFTALYILFTAISIFTAINPLKAFFQTSQLALSLASFFLLLQLFGENENYDKWLIMITLLLAIGVTISVINKDAIMTLLHGSWISRAAGRFTNPNPPALLAGMAGIFSFYLFLKNKFPLNLIFLAAFILFFLVIMCAGSRNALISILVSLFTFAVLYFRSNRKKGFLLLLLVIILMAFFMFTLGRVILMIRLNPETLKYDTSILSRLILWRNSINYFIKSPFKPFGPGNFFYFSGSLSMPFAHNFLINTLVESGLIPALMLLVAMVAGVLRVIKVIILTFKNEHPTLEQLVSAVLLVYLFLILSIDQFLYDGSLWRFMLVFLAFAITHLWRNKGITKYAT